MKIMSIDAETMGLYGPAFAIAVIVRNNGKVVFEWSGRCADVSVTDEWVVQNVLPKIVEMPIEYANSIELEEEFWRQWMSQKDGAIVIAHCASPVESGLFRRCVERDIASRQWSAPYPAIHDVATALLMSGHDPSSVDAYAASKGISCEFEGATHHPMYDAMIAAQVWEHLAKK